MSDPRLIDISGEKRAETEKAIQIYDGAKTEWVPKSQVSERTKLIAHLMILHPEKKPDQIVQIANAMVAK